MTLTELRYIVALSKYKHFGNAAKSCFVSQPTLSVAINKLESKLGVTIFERLSNELRVTEIGKKIIEQAVRTLEASEQIKLIAKSDVSQLNAPLRIGAIFTVAPYLYPKLIPKIQKIAPNMPLIVQEDFTSNLKRKLQQGDLDVIIIAKPFSEKGLLCKSIYSEPFVCLMRKDHPLSKKTQVSQADLSQENILLLGEGHCFRDHVLQTCPGCSSANNQQSTIEGTSLETLRHLVVTGMGITILPSSATQINHYNRILCTRPFKESIPQREIAIAWRVSFPRFKVIDALTQAFQECKLNGICLLPNETESF